nr:histone-lysine N-methyltransferase, H3 lysine-9 specific SUVH4 isoform X1 [Tanacetum cinerariifolium]
MVKINETRRSSSRIKTIESNKAAVRQRKKEEKALAAAVMKKPAKKKQRVTDTCADVSAGLVVMGNEKDVVEVTERDSAASEGVVDVEKGEGGEVYVDGKCAGLGANESSYTRVKDTIRSFYKYYLQFVQSERQNHESSDRKLRNKIYSCRLKIYLSVEDGRLNLLSEVVDLVAVSGDGDDNDRCMVQNEHVRVIRGHESETSNVRKVYTYNGLYKAEKGISGYTVYKFKLKRVPRQPKLVTEQVFFSRGAIPNSVAELQGLVCEDISGGLKNIPIPTTNVVDDPPVPPTGNLP